MQPPDENRDSLNVHTPGRNSGAGKASFILSLAFGGLTLLLIFATGVVFLANSIGHGSDARLERILALGVLASLVGNVVGLVLGIVGVTRKDSKINLAVAGLTLNGLIVLGGVLFLVWYRFSGF